MLQVHAQGHGRCCLRRQQNITPVFGVVLLHPLDPPHRMVPKCREVLIGVGQERCFFSQKTAQTSVHKRCLSAHVFVPACRFHGLVDQGVHGVRRQVLLPRQGQHGAQQSIDGGRWCFARQTLAQGHSAAPRAHGLKRQRLNSGPNGFGHCL